MTETNNCRHDQHKQTERHINPPETTRYMAASLWHGELMQHIKQGGGGKGRAKAGGGMALGRLDSITSALAPHLCELRRHATQMVHL